MTKIFLVRFLVSMSVVLFIGAFAAVVYANHSWGGYHWARATNSFTLKLGDDVSAGWDAYLGGVSNLWSLSSVLDTSVVPGVTNPKNCRPKAGRVEVCNSQYGNNGWLGIASIWVSGGHIAQGAVKLNDTYFNTTKYNTPAWKNLVMCQEIAHTLGLDHQDENFTNANLGTCMDYTNDPDGTLYGQLDNQYPNQHDYEMLEAIYAHLDSTTGSTKGKGNAGKGNANVDLNNPGEWGRELRKASDGRTSLYARELGNGEKVFTFVIWAD